MSRNDSRGAQGSAEAAGDTPEFGKATLNNCEREQIHLPGSIQPHGCMLVVRNSDLEILQASGNATEILQNEGAQSGNHLLKIDAPLAQAVESLLAEDRLRRTSHYLQMDQTAAGQRFDVSVHGAGNAGVILEFETAGATADHVPFIEKSFQHILSALTLDELYKDATRIFKDLTGYDRVMLYQFDQEGHGKVIAERREPELEPYLGNYYPATDIPQIARRLYAINRIRMLVDVDYEPSPLVPRLSPALAQDLDMTLCQLRSVSPIHLQYLRNMGVCATLVISLMVGGKLWGLVSCHHYAPKFVARDLRMTAVLLAEMLATRIAALEGYAKVETEVSVHLIEKRIIEAIAREGDWKDALFSKTHELLKVLNATGAALSFEGKIHTDGDVPSTQDIKALVRWLDGRAPREVYSTSSLSLEIPGFESFRTAASGVVSVPISSSGGEYMLWFRPERRRTVTWGGNPDDHEISADNPEQLSPRQSFAKWYQLVEATADAWSSNDVIAAKRIGESIADMVYQLRAVRLLIAQDQISQLTSDVRGAKQPVVVVDRSGQLLLVNDAFYRLLPDDHAELRSIKDLPLVFKQEDKVRDLLDILLRDQHTGRTELELKISERDSRDLMLRADPVFAEMGRVLGYVLFFVDVTDRKKIEQGKKQFQKNILSFANSHQFELNDKNDVTYRNLLLTVVNNAKLAAMEIGDDTDIEAVPEMLKAIQNSVSTTDDMLRQLLANYPGKEQE